MLMLTFLAFSDMTWNLEDTRIGVFWLQLPPESKESKLGSSNQQAFPSAGQNSGVLLAPCCGWKCVPTTNSIAVDISEAPGCHLL